MEEKSKAKNFRFNKFLGVLAAGLLMAAACSTSDLGLSGESSDQATTLGGSDTTQAQPITPEQAISSVPAGHTVIVQVSDSLSQISVYEQPDLASAVVQSFEHPRFPPNISSSVPTVFTMVENPEAPEGWAEVNLPIKPNGSTGWIRLSEVTLASTPLRVIIDRDGFNLKVIQASTGDDGELVETTILDETVGIGTGASATPVGSFYVTELIRSTSEFYGPFAFGLSGFSEDLQEFAGQENAIIGIHGTNDPDSIGRQSSNGCVRIDNELITLLADTLPLGTPVEIF